MLTLVYFARFREALGLDQEQIELAAHVSSVAQLMEQLIAQRDERWQQVLSAPNLLVAVNQQMVDVSHPLCDGDEVAFFPPVTGG